MIPKTIHYCWFGRNPKPRLAEKCIKSWRKYCPDYEIIEWNEDNFDLDTAPLYVRQAYEAKKWAFVTDYVRLKVVHDYGGIYLDTDVELIKPLDDLRAYEGYFGFEGGKYIATGLGFGCVQGAAILKELMQDYETIPFFQGDGQYDIKTCPIRNTEVFLRHGLIQDDSRQLLDNGILILPTVFLCPISYLTGKRTHSRKTVSIHWFAASWQSEEMKQRKKTARIQRKKRKILNTADYLLHLPNRITRKLMGDALYEALKDRLKRG